MEGAGYYAFDSMHSFIILTVQRFIGAERTIQRRIGGIQLRRLRSLHQSTSQSESLTFRESFAARLISSRFINDFGLDVQ